VEVARRTKRASAHEARRIGGACPGSHSLSQPDSNLDADYLPTQSRWMKLYLPRCEDLAFQKESPNGPC